MTSKEALTLLIPKDIQTHIDFRNKYGSSIKGFIIQDLDRLEKLEKENQELEEIVKLNNHYVSDLENERTKLKEELKAFELIKNKEVNVMWLKEIFKDGRYCYYKYEILYTHYKELTEEEFNFLKEVLK